ncbi:hypothetical protein [Sphingobium aromaticiconvertens]|uniref:hypothetical protein n=1 Tax=Sphingobium aromaticiconvertens TaxID=365341 RepID=UPI003015916D
MSLRTGALHHQPGTAADHGPVDGFAVTQDEPVIGGLHGEIRHHFCPHCKS